MQQMSSTTVGVEIELEGFTSEAVKLPPDLRYQIHDDGSIRQPTYTVDGFPIAFRLRSRDGRLALPSGISTSGSGSFGLEIVTEPYEYRQAVPLFAQVADAMRVFSRTPMSSIHIHVGCQESNWREIQRLLQWVYWLEAPLYRMAACGRSHRGSELVRSRVTENERRVNNYMYCRPLSAPIGVMCSGRYVPLIDTEQLLSANSASDMLAAWGRLDQMWPSGIGRWIPHRLHCVNVIALARYGTFEWRLFDAVYSALPVFLDIVVGMHRIARYSTQSPRDFVQDVLGRQTPLTLGQGKDITPEESDRLAAALAALLDADVSSVWGKSWSSGVYSLSPRSHYADYSIVPISSSNPVVRVRNPVGDQDTGGDNFHPGAQPGRRARRIN